MEKEATKETATEKDSKLMETTVMRRPGPANNPKVMDKKAYRRAFVARKGKNDKTDDINYDPKTEVYEKKFSKIESKDRTISWNWCAFLFTPLWLLYRRLYRWFFAFLVAGFALEGITRLICNWQNLDNTQYQTLDIILYLALCMFAGVMADRIYLKRIDHFYESSDKDEAIIKHGGTSAISIAIYIAVSILLATLRSVLAM